jgi:hypothetical protein
VKERVTVSPPLPNTLTPAMSVFSFSQPFC